MLESWTLTSESLHGVRGEGSLAGYWECAAWVRWLSVGNVSGGGGCSVDVQAFAYAICKQRIARMLLLIKMFPCPAALQLSASQLKSPSPPSSQQPRSPQTATCSLCTHELHGSFANLSCLAASCFGCTAALHIFELLGSLIFQLRCSFAHLSCSAASCFSCAAALHT